MEKQACMPAPLPMVQRRPHGCFAVHQHDLRRFTKAHSPSPNRTISSVSIVPRPTASDTSGNSPGWSLNVPDTASHS